MDIKSTLMRLPLYQVDAFSNHRFGGNPAAVCSLKEWLPDDLLQKIASENNLSETAFFVPKGDQYELRWFTPAVEVDLCGHATLATAHVLFQHLNYDKTVLSFHSPRSGVLSVQQDGDWYTMNFPVDVLEAVAIPEGMPEALGITPKEMWKGKTDYLAIIDTQEQLEALQPNFHLLAQTHKSRGTIVSAKGKEVDFVSRGFFPQVGIDEDPVTGSAHTTLTPYWAKKLNKTSFTAQQISQRKGHLKTVLKGNRVEISGQAVTYLVGEIEV